MGKSTCCWPECENPTYVKGLCRRDYTRAYRLQEFDSPWIAWSEAQTPDPCRWPKCGDVAKSWGMCRKHYTRARRMGNKENPWDSWTPPGLPCIWPGCDREAESKRMCDRHYKRARRVGDFEAPWSGWEEYERETEAQLAKNRSCKWPECDAVVRARNLCVTHYERASSVEDFEAPWVKWDRDRQKECSWCGTLFRRLRINAIYCGPVCSGLAFQNNNPEAIKKAQRAYARRNPDKLRMKNNTRRVRQRLSVVEKFSVSDVRAAKGDDCYLCGSSIDFDIRHPNPMSASLDHIVPVSKGGHHTLDNAAMAHLLCNMRKGASLVAPAI